MGLKVIRPLAEHRDRWNELYSGYAAFYWVDQSQEMRDRVWGWINDPSEELNGLIAVDESGHPIGLTHFRQFTRPLMSCRGGFLDDLFVDPQARGSGAAQALIAAVAEEGRKRGWTVIRWITRDNNYRARSAYDRLATRTDWVTYDIPL